MPMVWAYLFRFQVYQYLYEQMSTACAISFGRAKPYQMKINRLIDRRFGTASVLEDTRDTLQFLKDCEYLAVVDEGLKITGIVTLKDLYSQPDSRNLLDCKIDKPLVSPDQTIFEVFYLMMDTGHDFLPVYENENFAGVITLKAITGRFATVLEESKREYQKVIHDLRNPISNLHGLIGLLNDTVTDSENNDIIKLCKLSCKHAMNILDDLLFVEVDENRPMNKISTELNTFYKQCIDEQLGLCVLKNITMHTDFCEANFNKDIDPTLIKRAVQNVIANAVKFSYPDSTIKISTLIKEERLVLKIVDAGIGIPEEYQDKIFDKFTPAGRTGTNGEPSTGLGLCFTKQCLEQHGGEIYFKSTEGKGSKFYICL